jgi:phosphate transport system substrate-binding protein
LATQAFPDECENCGAALPAPNGPTATCAYCGRAYQAATPAAPPEVVEALRKLQQRMENAPRSAKARRSSPLLGIGCAIVVLGVVGIFALLALGVNADSAKQLVSVGPQPSLRFCGSNTIASELAPALVEAFLVSRGAPDVRREVSGAETQVSATLPGEAARFLVSIRGAGTATAFQDLSAGKCDVAMASRAVQANERAQIGGGLNEQVLALDGIAVIVHPSNRLAKLDTAQLAAVFAGRTLDWSALGGSPGPIQVVSFDDRSGTYDTFRSLVLGSDSLSAEATRFANTADVLRTVASSPNAIGFSSLSAARGVKDLAVAEPGVEALAPSTWSIARESYALTRRLYLYTHPQRTRPAADALVAFALSAAGQSVVSRVGFVDLSVQAEQPSTCAGCPAAYIQATRGSRRLSVDFRFESGSSDLDSRAVRDADRVLEFAKANRNPHVELLGFADARGAAVQNQHLSVERAERVKFELARRGLNDVSVLGLGSLMPLASNDSEQGRQKNRRVEIWIRN